MDAPAQVVEPSLEEEERERWENEEGMWEALNREAFGRPEFHPITTKAMYVLGIIHGLCTSVSCLLKGPVEATYVPAYGVFASGADLLGRCIQGNSTPWTAPQRGAQSDLEKGFRWLANSYYRGQVPDYIIQTSNGHYGVDYLVALRHFAAHGQATTHARYRIQDVDYEILGELKPLMAQGLDSYWERLKAGDQSLSNNLARANVKGLRFKPVEVILLLFSRDPMTGEYRSVKDLFSEFEWQIGVGD